MGANVIRVGQREVLLGYAQSAACKGRHVYFSTKENPLVRGD